ncbi:uncharacterized protein LOC142325371 isoform X2 [Lycorma delicatula]|uniref:uncharacterized protein LOC142325371 isoform X2 n=1 Tax=Lycorma delicatula TaxID=130591 RepID=UPI003F512DF4
MPVDANPACCDRMDNEAFVGDEKNKTSTIGGVELQEVQVPQVPVQTVNMTTKEQQCCKADLCQKMHMEYLERTRQEVQNPTDRVKTLFFIGTLGLFVIWLVLYSTLSKFDLF